MIEQYSKEWFDNRMGKITSSTIWNLIVEPKEKIKKDAGELSSTTKDYLMSKLAERLTGVQREFKSDATAHGLELEAEALMHYMTMTKNVVSECGYIEKITGLYGGTPDGLVNDDGIIQVKCPYNYTNHIHYGLIDSVAFFKAKYREYYWQCQSDMLVAERTFCDFVSYCPDMPDKLKMFTLRIPIDYDDCALLLQKVESAGKYLNNLYTKIINL
jgi:exodeoxyribonuclease (lambda-induced)